MYVIKVVDEDKYISAVFNTNTKEWIDSLDRAKTFLSISGAKIITNRYRRPLGKLINLEIREVEIKLK